MQRREYQRLNRLIDSHLRSLGAKTQPVPILKDDPTQYTLGPLSVIPVRGSVLCCSPSGFQSFHFGHVSARQAFSKLKGILP